MDLPILGTNRNRLLEMGFKEEDLDNQWPLAMMGLAKKMMTGDPKAIDKMQELVNQNTNKMIALKERELEIRERELAIKEAMLQNGIPDNDRVTIINDIDEDD